jgi:FkbM family methyltransferase
MRVNPPNIFYAIAHPIRALRYLRYRDLISYDCIARYIPSDPVIVEAGAHDGTNTVEMADFWPRATIHAFEPVSSAALEVRRKVARFAGRVQCHELALGARESLMEMHVSGEGAAHSCQSSSLLTPTDAQAREFPAIAFGAKCQVQMTSLDAWAASSSVPFVDFMWLDMQGYELEALAGASRFLPRISAIHMEVCNVELYEGAPLYPTVRRTMADYGFEPAVEAFFRVSGNVLFVRRRTPSSA